MQGWTKCWPLEKRQFLKNIDDPPKCLPAIKTDSIKFIKFYGGLLPRYGFFYNKTVNKIVTRGSRLMARPPISAERKGVAVVPLADK
jgi:hypothetical protein